MNTEQRRKALKKNHTTMFGHSVLLDSVRSGWARTWCEQQFGKRYEAVDNKQGRWACFWAGRDHPSHYRFHFTDEQDRMWFVLRWS